MREGILQAGLRVIDQRGSESLIMRNLAQELGVDLMARYRHVEDKDALLDGVPNLLWEGDRAAHAEFKRVRVHG